MLFTSQSAHYLSFPYIRKLEILPLNNFSPDDSAKEI